MEPGTPPPAARSVAVALSANAFLAVAKLVVFLLSGSASMFAEFLHSVADLANQALLAVGLRRSEAPPDAEHPYGYGRERTIWALLAASGVLFLGAGATLWNGLERLVWPGELERLDLALAVLGLALVAEGSSFAVALRGLLRSHGREELRETLRHEADPVLIGVLFEDGAAMVGVLVAGLVVALAHLTGDPL